MHRVRVWRNTLEKITPCLTDLARSLQLFANFKPEGPYYSNWGKENATMIFIYCQEKKLNAEH